METIGIIAAMPQERDALLHFVSERATTTLGSYRCQRFRLAERDCWLLTSGMGIERAARAAQVLVDVLHPQLLVSVGVAGAVNPDLEIGDVVVSQNTCLLEQGLPGPFQPLALLSGAAWQAAVQALQPRAARLFRGTAVTTRGAQFVGSQPDQMPNPVLEMETIGIARVAALAGAPLLSIRAISDGPRAPIPFDLEAMTDEHFNLRTGRLIRILLAHPRLLPQLLRMGRNTKMAAENAAIAWIAALSQPGDLLLKR